MPSHSFSSSKWLAPPIQTASFKSLLVIPILLSIATFAALFTHSDVDIALLWSQCHSRARIPGLSHIPLIGTPSCFLVSFFQCALDSLRSKAVMGVILAYVGALATVCTVESARRCNRSNTLIAKPTLWWLLFNLLGGAMVWQLVIVPAFLHRAKALVLAEEQSRGTGHEDSTVAAAAPEDASEEGRTLPDSEAVAIPIAVAAGYFLPSILMLVFNSPATITVWLFFPLYVSLVRQGVRYIVERIRRVSPTSIHHESHWQCVALVYALPIVLSVAAHIFVLWNLAQGDDRKKMTKLTVSFIEIDIQFIAWTVLYWVFVEAGWRVPLSMIATSILAGPGAGTIFGWLYRERLVKNGFADLFSIIEDEDNAAEERPLLG
ncbi:uncharacterized protein TRIVIDRAFT_176263 [Trichoderma virens Gv29-8]|uniref:Uncharacterized protein n=1 Tax=Hypocrea virens (strain Gv29-8 / FGSC 10586) TaxID=413071 RepID=G9MGS9_HYPVG|nr:uncharacterized protein TRIVIDRAFT_176263 [Trichoderma virens Gv29-8]EHK25924.1 hypothetical protein TRIVIDRAFT_176263 [Trichoderma virens Gv29-8]UKZ46099.1 hypothetical protein TrVGV298_000297 [Trichoderma virens]